ncbi:hypothetical protein [Rhizorhapis sp. SPR117]|uniref:hypothetical protein n=1 Tax=Rhizorhapis sp. SPR117 TaxID=2912611 RepID=UPI001F40D18F|nr:hypothetical protein [Rhizorhapis sp. SPR117]
MQTTTAVIMRFFIKCHELTIIRNNVSDFGNLMAFSDKFFLPVVKKPLTVVGAVAKREGL